MYKLFIKELLDFFISIFALIVFIPLILLITVILFFSQGKNSIFFYQLRSGKGKKLFKLVKFKTMNDKKDKDGHLLPDKDRLSKVGIFLRKTSLDELPQLFNVLLGDMSIVGPRPLLPEYLKLYDNNQIRRNEVKPGITGWAQVHGRNSLKLSERFKLDVWYVDNITFLLDIEIIVLTIKSLFTHKVVACRQDLQNVDDLNFDSRAFKN